MSTAQPWPHNVIVAREAITAIGIARPPTQQQHQHRNNGAEQQMNAE
ncbi:hypothetical protein [Cyanobium sp. ATX-6F1]